MLPKSNRDMNDRRVPGAIWELFFLIFCMEEIKNKEFSERVQYIIENFELLTRSLNLKILWWWRILGLMGLALLMVIGYVFCPTSSHLVVLGFIGLFLLCGWMIGSYYIQRGIVQSSNIMLEYKELTDLKLYIADVLLTDAIEIKARGSYSRDRLQEIKALCELLRTQEGIEKATSILKAFDLNLNDIQWMEGSKTGIRIIEENGKKE